MSGTTKKKLMYQFVSILFILQSTLLCMGQGEADKWYFGQNAGLDFSSGTAVAISGGQLNTLEGNASISDASGNLLFYTDGVTIWNSAHAIMTNGTGLMGHWSSTQSALIIPDPYSTTIYYVFTVTATGGFSGFRYSEVDISLSGGLGAVNGTKNVLLVTPVLEKVSAVTHANGTDIWVVTHGFENTNFHAFLISPTGLNTTPVTTATGVSMGDVGGIGQGQLKMSPDGTKLALLQAWEYGSYVYDFNSSTGVVSNEVKLNSLDYPYGVEFSQNSKVLYISNNFYPDEVYQYDLTASDIPASELMIIDASNTAFTNQGSLQMGPDNKIYVSSYGAPYITAINNPNTVGMGCDYQRNAVTLIAGTTPQYGLPPFNQSQFSSPLPVELVKYEATCQNETASLIWTTASETNNDYFTVERSDDAVGFEPIGIVNGNGNSSTMINYNWTDDNPIKGTAYYRLKQTDYNGDFEYHGVKVTTCNQQEDFNIYPNPFENIFTIQLSEKTAYPITVEVLNYLGEIVHTQIIENGKTSLVLEKYYVGTYFVKVSTETTQIVKRAVKMK